MNLQSRKANMVYEIASLINDDPDEMFVETKLSNLVETGL